MERREEDTELGSGGISTLIKERIVSSAVLLTVAGLTLSDLVEDRIQGASWAHLSIEGLIIIFAVLTTVFIWRQSIVRLTRQNYSLSREVDAAREDAKRWRAETASIIAGLGEAINLQFERWELTDAEKEVGMLLLKGLSHKEIANVRSTGERTVRQQATAVYRKAGLDGRSQLSAFFLEDLLLPLERK